MRCLRQLGAHSAFAILGLLAMACSNETAPLDPSAPALCDRYVGDLQGIQAIARVVVEPAFTTTYVSGDIDSGVAYYTFTGELLGHDPYSGMPTSNVGYVDVLDHSTNERFRAEIALYVDHFTFLVNPFEGLYTTEYRFDCE